jgi:hypothetical protein
MRAFAALFEIFLAYAKLVKKESIVILNTSVNEKRPFKGSLTVFLTPFV